MEALMERGERKLKASKSEQQILALPSDMWRHEGQHWTVVTSLEERREGEPQSASSGRSNHGITIGKEASR